MADIVHHHHHATFSPDVPARVFWAGAVGALLVLTAAWYALSGGMFVSPAFDPSLTYPPLMLPMVPLL